MTEMLYLTDAYKKRATASVSSCEKKGNQWEIALNQTIFYPQGGGQPSDKGLITGPKGKAHVKHVKMQGDTVVHECTIEGEILPNDRVELQIDWNIRYLNMRIHSAGHIVHEAVMKIVPSLIPLKGEHGANAYIEYKGNIPLDKKSLIQHETNTIVQNNLTLLTEFVSHEELEKRSSYIPAHLPKNKPLRIAQIEGFQAIPDGGTQVTKTSEVGSIEITDIENTADEIVRIHYTVEKQIHEAPREETQDQIATANLIGLLLEVQEHALSQIREENIPVDQLKLTLLGGRSELSALTKKIRLVPPEGRVQVGTVINQVKQTIEQALKELSTESTASTASDKTSHTIDVTMPGLLPTVGHYHPTTIVISEMNTIFQSMGFSIADGPEIENDEYNYNRLNLPADHPARDLQDSLYIEEPNWLLRTHTSSVESHLLAEVKPPFRYVIPGKVYRFENANATNNIMFYQYEGMAVAKDITMAQLKGTLDMFVKKFFGEKRETRFRCKYYPQVEPGVGVDISCAFCNKKGCTVCKYRGWIEMLGAGMVHPNMFRKAGLDPEVYSGFAWGMGLDRIVMQRYGISDIRSLYNGDIGYKE
jgi:phenylalanyl-tRNA synthetase alpha chain